MKYKVVGYGSFLSHRSLASTIKNKAFTPVIIKGYKRIFNIISEEEDYLDVLNIKKTSRAKLNGVLFFVTKRELEKLKQREDIYHPHKVTCYDFTTKKNLGRAFTFIDHYYFIDKIHKKPHKQYFKLCRNAAYHISKEFGKYWDQTTYLSNGKKVATWIKRH